MHYLYVQNDLSNFHESSSSVNLELNNSKCKVLRITQRHNKLTYPYKLNNTILESTGCERDLGVLTSSTLTWSQQVDYLCNKATKMLGYVRRSTLNINDTIVRRRLYLCLVRSQLCYGSQIWAPQSVALVKRMESLQRRATKYILNLPFRCDTTYNERPTLLDLLPLCYWHEFLDMVTFYKLTHGIMTIDNNLLQPSPDNNNNRRETTSFDLNHLSFTAAQCRTSTYQRSFLNRTKKIWNVLPKSLTNNNISLGQFKNGLCKYYKSALKDVFDVDNPKTWKSICLSCNKSRNLSCQMSCY